MTYPKELFTPCQIGNKTAPNRLVSQAMEGNDGIDGGQVSKLTLERYANLAKGNWGIVVVEALSVTDKSLARINGMVLKRENLDSFKLLVDTMRNINPETIILFQISHSGRNSNEAFSEKTRVCPNLEDEGRYLSTDEIEEIKQGFIESSLLAQEAGADGVDFKMCHGYFGAEILRPQNTRDDRWGGSWENRTRFLREGVSEIKKRCNKDFIIGSRISMYEAMRGCCGTAGSNEIIENLDEQIATIKLMSELKMDYVNISAGIPGKTSHVTRPVKGSEEFAFQHFRYTQTAKKTLNAIKSNMKVIGSAFSIFKEQALEYGAESLKKDNADFVGFGRQSFADPLTPAKILKGEDINWCIGCSGCTKMMIEQIHDGCMVFNPYYKDLWKQHRSAKRNTK